MTKRTSILVSLAFVLYAGVASADGLVFNTDEVDFGVVLEGNSALASVTLTNTSAVDVSGITLDVLSSDFTVGKCGSLYSGQSCKFYVQFTPSRKGAFIQYLTANYEINGFAGKTKLQLEGYSQPFNQ